MIYLSLLCHHQNDYCIKMGSDESLFLFYFLLLFMSSLFFCLFVVVAFFAR